MLDRSGSLRLTFASVSQMSERVAAAAAAAGRSVRSAVSGVSAHREMPGPIASAGGVREMNPRHHSIAPEVALFNSIAFISIYCL